jgi:ABC-type lipoprotein release transport system permease subunit
MAQARAVAGSRRRLLASYLPASRAAAVEALAAIRSE